MAQASIAHRQKRLCYTTRHAITKQLYESNHKTYLAMKKTIVFLVGLLAGTGIAFVVWGIPLHKRVANQYLLSVTDQALIAVQLNEGHIAAVEESIARSLPEYVEAIDSQFKLRDEEVALNALWMVRLYYERQNLSPPAAVQSILLNLPDEIPAACQERLDNMAAWSDAMDKQSELVISLPESDSE